VALVGVETVARALNVSARQVQKFAEREGMPREAHGQYNLAECMMWYVRRLHQRVCGCAGPCEGFKPSERNMANARAERRRALKEVRNIAEDLVGLDAEEIRERLTDAVKQTYDDLQLAQEEE
jgi:hypothetical protein